MNLNSPASFDWLVFPVGTVLCLVRVFHDIAEVNKPNSTQQQIRETACSLKSFTTTVFIRSPLHPRASAELADDDILAHVCIRASYALVYSLSP
jgi:hypothetical protein